jgi:hypothetical protein
LRHLRQHLVVSQHLKVARVLFKVPVQLLRVENLCLNLPLSRIADRNLHLGGGGVS